MQPAGGGRPGRPLSVQVDAGALAPKGGTFQLNAGSVEALGDELGRELRLADVSFQVFDADFEECAASRPLPLRCPRRGADCGRGAAAQMVHADEPG